MTLIYTLFIRIAYIILHLVAPFNTKLKKFLRGRKTIFINLKRTFAGNELPVIWFHTASVGEFEQAIPIVEQLKSQLDPHRFLITFFSPSGYEYALKQDNDYIISYLPIDTPQSIMQLIGIAKPKMAVFIKYEFWYNTLTQLKKQQVPTFLASAIFRPELPFFQWYGFLHRRMLSCYDFFFLQNQESANLLAQQGITNFTITGDTRFDQVTKIKEKKRVFPEIERLLQTEEVIIIGSSWPDDHEILIPFINENINKYQFIIAPHEINEKTIDGLTKRLPDAIRYTNLKPDSKSRILIIDNIGMLSSLYALGKYAYIGGAFGDGLHNILEPAVYELPVLFGNKNYKKFNEANEMLASKCAFLIDNTSGLNHVFSSLESPKAYSEVQAGIAAYFKKNVHAADKTVDVLIKHLKRPNHNK